MIDEEEERHVFTVAMIERERGLRKESPARRRASGRHQYTGSAFVNYLRLESIIV
jgi:hypothetical protein